MKKTGGTAFPFTPTQDRHCKTKGMTLRDYFAGQALCLMTNTNLGDDEVARHAYTLADAMLKERDK